MHLTIGTSGYSYPAWKGSFYPEKLPAKQMLSFYAERFSAVEINNTFYRMPRPEGLLAWAGQVGSAFRFAIKAPQRITHHKRLNDAGEDTRHFLETVAVLEDRLGPLLFQLPPNLKLDLPRLEAYLDLIPTTSKVAFEFRHASWHRQETYDCLRTRGAALCLSETDELPAPRLATASWGYLRLRKSAYAPNELAEWVTWIRNQPWEESFVFFKHEDEGRGPAFGLQMQSLWASGLV